MDRNLQPSVSNSSGNRERLSRESTKRNVSHLSPEQAVNQQLIKVGKSSENLRSRSPSIQSRIPDYWLATNNRFDPLVNDMDIENENKDESNATKEVAQEKAPPRPPPIFIHGVGNINPLIMELEKVVQKNYKLQVLNNEKVKINLDSKDNYQVVVKLLKEKKTEFHSFQLKDEKAFRIVLKGVHHEMETNHLITAFKEIGHEVQNIIPVISRKTGKKLPMFFINLKKKDNNKEAFKITRFENMVVSVEVPHNTKYNVVQCKRCQRYGHSQNYCSLGARCVKCPDSHATADCPRKVKDSQVKCVNCGGGHPANYRGCEIYQKLREKLQISKKNNKENETVPIDEYVNPNISYAKKITKVSDAPPRANDMDELKSMMKNILTQMSTMLNLLTALVSKSK